MTEAEKSKNRVGKTIILIIMKNQEEFKIEELEQRLELGCSWSGSGGSNGIDEIGVTCDIQ